MRRRVARHARCVLGSQYRPATASHQWTLISIARAVDAVDLEAVAMGGFATTEFSSLAVAINVPPARSESRLSQSCSAARSHEDGQRVERASLRAQNRAPEVRWSPGRGGSERFAIHPGR